MAGGGVAAVAAEVSRGAVMLPYLGIWSRGFRVARWQVGLSDMLTIAMPL